jgi:hypothetical protein
MNSYLERLRMEIEDAAATAGAEALEPAPSGKWNAAQILEHLFLTYKVTSRGLAKCMERGAPLATRGTLKARLAAAVVVNLGYMPGGRKSPERALPQGMPFEEVWASIIGELQRMGAGLEVCERRFGVRTKILDHPFLGPLTADEWRKFHWVHGRHHTRQIRERCSPSR